MNTKLQYSPEDIAFAASIGVQTLTPTQVYANSLKRHLVNSVARARRDGYNETAEIIEKAALEFVSELDRLSAV